MMKKLLLILLMLLSVSAFAQKRKKHAKKKVRHSVSNEQAPEEEEAVPEEEFKFVTIDSHKKIVLNDPPEEKDRPFVLIDDVAYDGRLQDIPKDNITDVSVIHRKGARMIYGAKAANGALIITTKHPLPADIPNVLLPLPKQHSSQKPIMLNEELSYSRLEDLNPKDILKVDTLIQPKFIGSKDNDTITNVTTRVYGKKLYQWKFGTLSKAYKTFIRGRRGNDNGVNYVLADGTILTGGKEEDLIELLNVYHSDPKAASFTGPQGTRKNRKPATLIIELNQPVN